jgi:hypothetical protein
MESLGNILIYFLKQGKLPWSHFVHPSEEQNKKDGNQAVN